MILVGGRTWMYDFLVPIGTLPPASWWYDFVLTIGQEIELIWHTASTPFVRVTDAVSSIMAHGINVTNVVLTAMLGVVMIARLHAMYQGSRIMLIFLVIIFLEEVILFGIHDCAYGYDGDVHLLIAMVWMLNTVWEVLALCLSVWIAVKHFRDLRRFGPSTGSTIGDCFRALIKSHVLYFAR
ncbi:hypothetical protein CY34DRAFT_627873 [Suillus luteus UH-Slu-Lm8-n1]|uniref:Uncharacterized protein n=1 Tax=Suillus luteus UH-Slu-Lm8-n1 TaxID=930992 RepID=A0A0D0BFS1_9AGAM|nr:hypothetical protein CY34DRAFT_627873 [Suillus luteus UH-Slu-Lm8-n1]